MVDIECTAPHHRWLVALRALTPALAKLLIVEVDRERTWATSCC